MRGPMNGKVAMITGVGRGIGRTIALELASRGATLVLTDRNAGALNETARLISANLTGELETKSMSSMFAGKLMWQISTKSLRYVRTRSRI